MSRPQVSHLEDDQLLRLLDGELPDSEASAFRSHVKACWTCRTRMEELESSIGDYVRYRDAMKPLYPPPPRPWSDLQPSFERVDRTLDSPGPRNPRHVLRLRPAHWLALAAALIAAIVLIRRMELVPSVSAAELLRKAIAVQSTPAPRRRIRIRTRHHSFTRAASLPAATSSQDMDIAAMFERAHFNWQEPLSARSFAEWRDRLPQKCDDVRTVGNEAYIIQTSTSSSELRQATMTLRRPGLEPTGETLEFATGTVEITAAPDEEAAAPETPPARAAERAPARTTAPETALSPLHRELQVFAALHQIGADLGEPVELGRDGSHMTVTGTGLTTEQKGQLRASLEKIPGVEVRFEDATPSPRAVSAPADPSAPATVSSQLRLQAMLGARESVEDFTNRVLDASDAMMARVHALRGLAQAFRPADESSLSQNDRAVLASLRTGHATALAEQLRELKTILEPVLPPQLPRTENVEPANWQAGAQALFSAAQNLDQLLNRNFAGSKANLNESDFEQIAAALARASAAQP